MEIAQNISNEINLGLENYKTANEKAFSNIRFMIKRNFSMQRFDISLLSNDAIGLIVKALQDGAKHLKSGERKYNTELEEIYELINETQIKLFDLVKDGDISAYINDKTKTKSVKNKLINNVESEINNFYDKFNEKVNACLSILDDIESEKE